MCEFFKTAHFRGLCWDCLLLHILPFFPRKQKSFMPMQWRSQIQSFKDKLVIVTLANRKGNNASAFQIKNCTEISFLTLKTAFHLRYIPIRNRSISHSLMNMNFNCFDLFLDRKTFLTIKILPTV